MFKAMLQLCKNGKLNQLKRATGDAHLVCPDTLCHLFYTACSSGQLVCAKWLWHRYNYLIVKSPQYKYIGIHIYMAEQYDVYEWLMNKCDYVLQPIL